MTYCNSIQPISTKYLCRGNSHMAEKSPIHRSIQFNKLESILPSKLKLL
uniref:Uncharacterized protein n=1 Tax=Rhizophora mucronata TaxID=61149 RepID=A0A2P2IZK4_RHIMU